MGRSRSLHWNFVSFVVFRFIFLFEQRSRFLWCLSIYLVVDGESASGVPRSRITSLHNGVSFLIFFPVQSIHLT